MTRSKLSDYLKRPNSMNNPIPSMMALELLVTPKIDPRGERWGITRWSDNWTQGEGERTVDREIFYINELKAHGEQFCQNI